MAGRGGARATLRVPGDKSLTHRALLLGALAEGESRLQGLLPGADPRSTARALRALGAEVPDPPDHGGEVRIRGVGLRGLREPDGTIDCGNSGTTARLLMGVLAGQPFSATLDGDASLRSRPMRRVTEPLAALGARVAELGVADRLPVRITGGRLRPGTHESPRASAQVKSAVLLAGLTGGVPVRVREPHLSRDHTERMLRGAGVDIATGVVDGRPEVALTPVDRMRPLDMAIPGDVSSAAFFVVLGLLAGAGPLRIEGVGLNPTRTGFLDVVRRMGGHIAVEERAVEGAEPVGDILVEPSALRGTTVTAAEIPALLDEVPALAVLAARATGETRVEGAEELRVKESDRLRALAENLRAVGVQAVDDGGTLTIVGQDGPLAGRVAGHGDHRVAMAFGVLGALEPGVELDDPGIVAISYPRFWEDLAAMRAELSR